MKLLFLLFFHAIAAVTQYQGALPEWRPTAHYVVPVLLTMLYLTQQYSIIIQYKLARSSLKKWREESSPYDLPTIIKPKAAAGITGGSDDISLDTDVVNDSGSLLSGSDDELCGTSPHAVGVSQD